jgi:PKD repeat protein
MKKLFIVSGILLAFGTLLFQSCKKESADPPKASIFYSVVEKQAAFTALTKRVVKWDWNFGDGKTSTEQNPVHSYDGGGYYTVTLTATGADGSTIESTVTIAVAVTPYVLLTGGATNVNGKTWRLTRNHSDKDKLANADATFTLADGAPETLPAGAFSLYLGMGEVYDDTFTFHFDGSYSHDVKADHASFAGLLYEYVTTGGAGIVNDGGAAFGLCTGLYTPESGATFTYVEKEDFAVPSVYGPDGVLTYKDVSTLDFSGTEFIGFMDNQRKVIVQEITDNSMRLVMFMAASQDYYPLNTHALILTFEVVK